MLKVVRGPIEFRRGVGKLVEQCVEGFRDKGFVLLFNRGPCSELHSRPMLDKEQVSTGRFTNDSSR